MSVLHDNQSDKESNVNCDAGWEVECNETEGFHNACVVFKSNHDKR